MSPRQRAIPAIAYFLVATILLVIVDRLFDGHLSPLSIVVMALYWTVFDLMGREYLRRGGSLSGGIIVSLFVVNGLWMAMILREVVVNQDVAEARSLILFTMGGVFGLAMDGLWGNLRRRRLATGRP